MRLRLNSLTSMPLTIITTRKTVISTRQIESGRTFAFTVDCTIPTYDFNGLKVGDTFFDMQRILGPPMQPYAPDDETVTYYNVTGLDWVTFTMRNGVITEITFYEGMAD